MFDSKFHKESELYPALKNYLNQQGYQVKGEVKSCDLMAEKAGVYLLVELKLVFNLKLVFQALERLEQCPNVIIAIPDYALRTRRRSILNLMKKLGIGVLTLSKRQSGIAINKELDWATSPKINKAFKQEFDSRSFDLSASAVGRSQTVTAYRENAIAIACLLKLKGELTVKEIRQLSAIDNAQSILAKNYDQFFCKVSRGVYGFNQTAETKLANYPTLVEFYIEKFRGQEC